MNIMRTRIPLILTASLILVLEGKASAQTVTDPILDYLAMDAPDRKEMTGTLQYLERVSVDIDGDGTNELFLGTTYRFSGSDAQFYVGYKRDGVGTNFTRITPATNDVSLQFETAYVGPISQMGRQGMLQVYGVSLDASSGDPKSIEGCFYYYIDDNTFVEQMGPPLNWTNGADRAFYGMYFGDDRKTRPVTIERLKAADLQGMGYVIPNWDSP